jgi:hypothetical protein
MKGERMSNSTLLAVRSDDEYIPNFLESLCQHDNASGTDTIIIGYQDLLSFGHNELENKGLVSEGWGKEASFVNGYVICLKIFPLRL